MITPSDSLDSCDQPNGIDNRLTYNNFLREYRKNLKFQLKLKQRVRYFETMLKQFKEKHVVAQKNQIFLRNALHNLIFKQKVMKKQVKLEKILSHDIYSFWNETDWSTRRMFYIMLYVYSDFCKTPTYISPPKSVEDTEYTLREEIKQKKYCISQLAHETEEPNLCDVLSMCIDHEYDWQLVETLV